MSDADLVTVIAQCPAMSIDLSVEYMPVELRVQSSEAMSIDVCWPPVRIEVVTDDGVVVTDEGEPVYEIVEG